MLKQNNIFFSKDEEDNISVISFLFFIVLLLKRNCDYTSVFTLNFLKNFQLIHFFLAIDELNEIISIINCN